MARKNGDCSMNVSLAEADEHGDGQVNAKIRRLQLQDPRAAVDARIARIGGG